MNDGKNRVNASDLIFCDHKSFHEFITMLAKLSNNMGELKISKLKVDDVEVEKIQ